jgi:hypothetical protein
MKTKRNVQKTNSVAFNILAGVIVLLSLYSCEKDKKDPALEATSITAISVSNYNATATVSEKGDYKILDHGFVFSVGTSPESGYYPENNKVSLGSTIEHDIFSATVNLSGNQYYISNELKVYVKAYITNERGTVYSKAISTEYLKLGLTSVTPRTAKIGDTVMINGKGFSTPMSQNLVYFSGVEAKVIAQDPTYLRVIVPSGIPSYYSNSIYVSVTSGGQTVQLENAFSLAATPVSFSPVSGNWTAYIVVHGFGLSNSRVYFDDTEITSSNYTNEYIAVSIPTNWTKKKFKIYVATGGIKTEVPEGYFTLDELVVNPLSVLTYFPGSILNFNSSGFNTEISRNKLFLGNTVISSTSSYYYSDLSFTIPASMLEGSYPVMLSNGADTAYTGQTITIKIPTISKMTPTSGYPASDITIEGQNLYSGSQNTYVDFGWISVSPSSSDAGHLYVNVPWLTAGQYTVTVYIGGYKIQIPEKYTVLEPKLLSISPASGIAGSSAIINGEGFGTKTSIVVFFGNLYAEVMSTTPTQINVKVPPGISKGNWIVKVLIYNNELSSTATFTVP